MTMDVDATHQTATQADGTLLRRLVWVTLGLYLVPAVLAVLLVAGLGMICCAVARWLAPAVGSERGEIVAGLRRDRAAQTLGKPHGLPSRVRLPRR